MSGYRNLKRALGETNIERKCRILFGVCLAVLIFGAFFYVDRICEDLVNQTTNRAGTDTVDMAMVDPHFMVFNQSFAEDPKRREQDEAVLKSFRAELRMTRYKSKFLHEGNDPPSWLQLKNCSPPANEFETSILRELRAAWENQIAAESSASRQIDRLKPRDTPSGAPKVEEPATSESTDVEESPQIPFKAFALPQYNRYYFYQPVTWARSCVHCHSPPAVQTSLESDSLAESSPPFIVVRVEMPYQATRDAVNWVRAWLIAAGILTVFVAMLGLYVIVRYVIVKPLKHLRDVSEEISQGQTSQRADIHTNDEFEELGDAFNRMLRHLTEAQDQLQATNSKLDAKVDELAQANMQLYEMNRLKSDFLANMSHELRTPLNSIIGFSDVLQGIEALTDKQRRYALNIQKSGRVLLDMINDVLDLAKLEAGKMELRPTEFRLDVVLSSQCDMMRSLSEDKNIDLDTHFDSEAPPIYQDQTKLQQVLTNLLSNAIKFTPEGGRITVRGLRNDADQMELTVSDTGVGIAEEDRHVIFEKFRQSAVVGRDALTREFSGTGLGLSIVKEMCKLLGGEVAFTSELGKGSTFKVVLPWSLPNRPRLNLDLMAKSAAVA